MQIETTTKTSANAEFLGANFKITTFEQTVTVFCDCCDNQATGNKQALENAGWELNTNCEFCPDCNY